MPNRPLILLHGALGAAEQFDPWIPALSSHFELHVLELEGHGKQAFADRGFAIPHFAENLAQYIHDHGLAAADIFGYSMGGYVAMYLARHQPELVGRIFAFSTKLDWNPESSALESSKLNPEVIAAKVPKFAQMLEARHSGNDWRAHLRRTAEMMVALGQSPALTSDDFRQLNLPVRLGVGDRDTMVSIEETVAAYRALPQGQFTVIPDTPHPIEKIDVPTIAAQILDFFRG